MDEGSLTESPAAGGIELSVLPSAALVPPLGQGATWTDGIFLRMVVADTSLAQKK